uniref:Reverse transcriptase domain-containing protein n=1 Tax=Tanacetum cinerariifolium TaxID=118510 RepID=A0A6L2M786_TANCI|nr:reverse transcriptase domain-containing protein [Tanacetum cinerariifolium]
MSDSKHSTVTYTHMSSDDGSLDEPPPPDFVPEPVYPEFMPHEDDVLPAKEQPLSAAISPTTDSPGYITEFDLEEDPEEEDDEDPEEDPTDYPADRDDDDDDEEEESSRDDVDDEDEDEEENEEEEEHLALAESIPPLAHRTIARMFIRAQTPIPFSSEAKVDRLLFIPTLPPSPLTPLSSPLSRIPSPPIPVPPLPTSPTDAGAPLGYRASMIRLKAESPSTSHPLPLPLPIVLPYTRASMVMMSDTAPSTNILAPRSWILPSGTTRSWTPPLLLIPLPTSSPPLLLPSTECRADVLEVTLPPRKSTLDTEIRRDPDREIGYEITDICEDPNKITEELPATNVAELGQRMTDFVTTIRKDIDEIYVRLDDAQDDILVMSGQLNLLRRDKRFHARTARLMKSEARASCEAWVQSMDASDMARPEKMAPTKRTTRAPPATTTTTKPVTNAKLKALINQGVADALAARDTNRSQNGNDSHNSRMVSQDFAHGMPWNTLMKMMTDKYCPRNEIKKLEMEIWELKVKGNDLISYTQRFQELALLCGRMFPEESDKIEKYVIGLPDMIHGSVMVSKPKTMPDAFEFTTKLMDKKIRTFAERQTGNKRKQDDNQQQQNKRQKHWQGLHC